ncbi:MAG: vitamin B12 dependent-methionine synthase activation domain-containing protein [Candidatus Marinimicrobia bacterium]|nr:vitamin B12 dependent-methionine synthase activation domain-containing protein [Candidatus Neomarinimicrobiota bacterium]
MLRYPAGTLVAAMDTRTLFRARWEMKKGGEDYLAFLLEDLKLAESIGGRAVYGYFPVTSDASTLTVSGKYRWEFPGISKTAPRTGLFSGSGGEHFLPLIAVTAGKKVVERSAALYRDGHYAEYFMLHGLAAELTETLCRLLHERINRELGVAGSRRRSPGHPGCPDLRHQRDILELLDTFRIGLSVTESGQLVPEFSSTAFILPSAETEARKEIHERS